jgi:hypothetical protein
VVQRTAGAERAAHCCPRKTRRSYAVERQIRA